MAGGIAAARAVVSRLGAAQTASGERENGRQGDHPFPHSPTPPFPVLMLATVTLMALALGWLIGLRYPFFPERGEPAAAAGPAAFIFLMAAVLNAIWVRARWAAIVTLALVVAMNAASLAALYLVPWYPGDDYRPLIARTVEKGCPMTRSLQSPLAGRLLAQLWQLGRSTALLTPDADWTPGVAAALDAALALGKVWFPTHLALGASWRSRLKGTCRPPCRSSTNGMAGTRLSGWSVTSQPQAVDVPPVRFPLRGRMTPWS